MQATLSRSLAAVKPSGRVSVCCSGARRLARWVPTTDPALPSLPGQPTQGCSSTEPSRRLHAHRHAALPVSPPHPPSSPPS